MDVVYIGHDYFLSLGINDLICVTFCVSLLHHSQVVLIRYQYVKMATGS